MKIIFINNFFTNYGGAEKSYFKISKILEKQNFEIYYFATDKKPYFIENYKYSHFFPKFKNKRNLFLGNIKNIIYSFYNFKAKRKLEKYLKEIKPDFIMIHNFLFYLSPSIFDACKKYNIPVLMYIHDPRLFCPGGMLAYNDKYCHDEPCLKGNPISCIKNKCKHSKLSSSVISSLNFLFNRNQNIYDKCKSIICISEALKDLAVKSGVPAEKIKVINHFIDDKEFKIIPNYTNENYFLYVGRLDKEKGVHFLIDAMKNVSSEVKLHIVGDGYEKDNLIRQAEKLNLNNVLFKGHLNGDELENEYKNCIATILPCNWFEAFGLTNIESFVYGKPVIASNIAAISEIIDDEINGILVPPANPKALTEAINKLYYNPELVVKMGQNGRSKAEEKYTQEVYWSKFEKEILNKI